MYRGGTRVQEGYRGGTGRVQVGYRAGTGRGYRKGRGKIVCQTFPKTDKACRPLLEETKAMERTTEMRAL